jgi:drug/metabolite transporter (DMT)-like permease
MNATNNAAFGLSDVLMLAAVVMWGVNFSFIKIALRELSPAGFNGLRLSLSALIFLGLLAISRERFAVSKKDAWRLLAIGVAGNTFYQLFFIQGIGLTSASNTSFILSMTPIFVALLSALLGFERIHWAAWLGIMISFFGLYLVIANENGGVRFSEMNLRGDLSVFLATILWAAYTVFSKPLLERMSPLKFSALTMAFGAFFYVPWTVPEISRISWRFVTWKAWGSLILSALFGLVVGYLIWYYSVKRVGNAKTAVYNNMTPIFTAGFAVLMLGEKVELFQGVGAGIILIGVYLTRAGYKLFMVRRPAEAPKEPGPAGSGTA